MNKKDQKQIDEFDAWRKRERLKHRVMTQAEYAVWRYSGDGISHPSSSNAFPGGLTILFGLPILGKTVDVPPNIGMPIKASSKFG